MSSRDPTERIVTLSLSVIHTDQAFLRPHAWATDGLGHMGIWPHQFQGRGGGGGGGGDFSPVADVDVDVIKGKLLVRLENVLW